MLVADLAQALQIALRRNQHAARARYRLDDHRGDIGRVVQRNDALLQLVGELRARGRLPAREGAARRVVGMAQMVHAGQHHAVGLAVGGHPAHRNAGEVDAVIAALAADEARARALALQAMVGERDFQRRVHRLGARIDEEHLLHALGREFGDAARDFERQRMAERERRGKIEDARLLAYRLDDFRPAMAGIDAPQRRQAVEHFLAFDRGVVHAFGRSDHARRKLERAVVRVGHPVVLEVERLRRLLRGVHGLSSRYCGRRENTGRAGSAQRRHVEAGRRRIVVRPARGHRPWCGCRTSPPPCRACAGRRTASSSSRRTSRTPSAPGSAR